METTAESFAPPPGLRNPHVQSLLSSSAARRWAVRRRARALVAASRDVLLDGGDGVRLLGHHAMHRQEPGPTVVLFHGWEGSAQSNYVLATGARLFAAGFDVFRLNFRDHGDSHHLNAGVFHSCRLDEVVNALADFQQRLELPAWGLAGYSLGGNFALRVALKAPERALNLRRVVAVCPVISPRNVLAAMESGPGFYEHYFVRKWARSMQRKRRFWPDRYDYDEWFKLRGLRERTRFLATRYYEYETLEHYLDGYSIAGDQLSALRVPSYVLTAADDPVVPVSDFDVLPEVAALEVHVTRHGGHCGFLRDWTMDSWVEHVITRTMRAALGEPTANSEDRR